ncbi:MAG: type II secretion system protein GspK [Sorangiineae bacterium]|nr:type II secretion system protein GspK [Polyangiaceae bacterium]MEB2321921.1 type II secretion system protein GspK [Sorangiineae bacterium]
MTREARLRRRARGRRRSRRKERGVALIMVLGALTVLTVMLTEFQDQTSAELGSALTERDALKAEYAAKSAINLSRLLIASEPTIRKALAPLFLLMRRGPPQIPVWQFADQVLGAFNDKTGAEAFRLLAGVDVSEGKHLGLDGAGFEITIVDEDSKIDLNTAARGDAFSQARLASQLSGLMLGPQYDSMFENADPDGAHSDRQTICSAIVDWTDPDQDAYTCDPHSGTAQQAGAEDSYYEMLKRPYQRKNAAFDSLEELRLVRGVGDDFWSTFIQPDPSNPDKRTVTVWGQGKVNVNTANAQTLLAVICGNAPAAPLCNDPLQASSFLSAVTMLRGFTMGAPLFSSTRGFVNTMKGTGPIGTVMAAVGLQPVVFLSDSETMKAITTESRVFSIYATGYVKAGKRETRVKVHAVVDFRGAPPPGMPNLGQLSSLGLLGSDGATGPGGLGQSGATEANPLAGLPADASSSAIVGALRPSAAGNIIYYRIN